jgi:hypothetical protein
MHLLTIPLLLHGAEGCQIHIILLMYPILKNYIQFAVVKEQYKVKLVENHLNCESGAIKQIRYCLTGELPRVVRPLESLDSIKLWMIDFEFFMAFTENIVDLNFTLGGVSYYVPKEQYVFKEQYGWT